MDHAWSGLADGWARWADQLDAAYAPVRSWLLDRLEPRAGETVLDLAAGTGSAGFDALARLGGQARLISIDLAAEMVAVARRRADEQGLHEVSFRVTDARDTGLATASVDRVLCESGYMLMPDPAAALRETRRVLRPGGRLAFSVWAAPEHNPWDTVGADALLALGCPPPDGRMSAGARLADEHHTRALLRDAGFVEVEAAHIAVRFAYADLDEWERWSIETDTTGPMIAALEPTQRAELRGHVADALAQYRTDDGGYAPPGLALCVAAA